MQKPLDGLSYFHVYDRIRLLCLDFLCNHITYSKDENVYSYAGGKLSQEDIARSKAFIDSFVTDPTLDGVEELADIVLDKEWELKWFWWHSDLDNFRIRDFADYIKYCL